MAAEIPAGTKVKVAMTSKGVTSIRDAEVLAHMDGLIHLDVGGDAVSVDPSQIVTGDAPIEGAQSTAFPPAPAENSGNAQIAVDVITGLTARVADLESRLREAESAITEMGNTLGALTSRVLSLETQVAAFAPSVQHPLGGPNSPAPAADPTPAPAEETPVKQASTAAADPGEPAAGS